MSMYKKIAFAVGFMVIGAFVVNFGILAWHELSPDHYRHRMTIQEDGKDLFSYPMGKLAFSAPLNDSSGYVTIHLKFSLVYNGDHQTAFIHLEKNQSLIKDRILFKIRERIESDPDFNPTNRYSLKDLLVIETNKILTAARIQDAHITQLTVNFTDTNLKLSPESTSSPDLGDSTSIKLHRAIESGNLKGVNELVKNEAYVNAKDSAGRTPLHYAAEKGDLQATKLLVNNGAIVNTISHDRYPRTPLLLAVSEENVQVAEFLINNGTKINFNPANQGGGSALHLASWNGKEKLVKLLLKNGADVNALDSEGLKPIDLAKRNNHERIVEILKNYRI